MEVLSIVAPVFGVIVLGALLRRVAFLGDDEVGALVKIVYYLGLPTVIFVAITSSEISDVVDVASLAGITCAIASFTLLFYWGMRPVARSAALRSVASVVVMRGNMAFVGLPIVYSAWGSLGLAKAGVIIGVLTGPFAIATVLLFRAASRSGGTVLSAAWRSFIDPIVIAALGGLAVSAAGIPLPATLQQGLDMLAGMALPAALLAIGASFTRDNLAGKLTVTGLSTVGKLVLMPLWGFLVLDLAFGISPAALDFKVAVFLLTTPSAVANYVMARELVPGESGMVGTAVAMSTAFAAPTMTLWLAYLVA